MTGTQPDTLTPDQAKEKYPRRFDQACREADVKALNAPSPQGVYWFGRQFIVDSVFVPGLGPALATFGPKGKL